MKLSAALLRTRNRHLLAIDVLLSMTAPLLAYLIRFEGLTWETNHVREAFIVAEWLTPIHVGVILSFGVYRCVWAHAGAVELQRLMAATAASAFCSFIVGLVVLPALGFLPYRVPLSVLVMTVFLMAFGTALPRLLLRISGWTAYNRARGHGKRVLVAGAGVAGKLILRELLANPRLSFEPVGFLDDDVRLHGQLLTGLPVLGPLSKAGALAQKHQATEIIIAMPSAPGSVIRQIVAAARQANVDTRIIPELSELLTRSTGRLQLRHVEIQDLLRREPVSVNISQVQMVVSGVTVLVTGAGGSIGGELCRQLAGLDAGRIILVGHGENSIFEIFHELRSSVPTVLVEPVIADVRDEARMRTILDTYRPNLVFHAAAHKHVPLMEENPVEAVTNNVLGTLNVVNAALRAEVQRFVLISTDKAVRPTSVMGATKRVAEQIVQRAAVQHGRDYVSVRFGNVLGSRGSVVPTFLRQIRAGGPVTITHPDMRRFFMTIPEAVQLVMQAGAIGRVGEVFVLDMGEPVKIADLAKDLIALCGLEVGRDIDIKFTGMRPGEKLLEETFFDEENAVPSRFPKILYSRKAPPIAGFEAGLAALLAGAELGRDAGGLRELLRSLVPDFLHETFAADAQDAEGITPPESALEASIDELVSEEIRSS